MRLRELKLQVVTAQGTYGARIEFPDGLVIVRADNSLGKSTCFTSILVALGMEAMLTTNQTDLPLTPAVLEKLQTPNGWEEVVESAVYLEIENAKKERLTVYRQLRGDRDQNLIGVWFGGALTSKRDFEYRDYFVNRGGGATREAGFHRELARFLGWNLPQVATFDGNESPLYMQILFPFFFVEQKRGWSSVVPILPSHLRVRNAHERAVEFLISLDAYKNAVRRQELDLALSLNQSAWSQTIRLMKENANLVNGSLQGISDSPVVAWPPEIPPSLMVPLNNEWLSIQSRIANAKSKLHDLIELEIPRVEQIANEAESELSKAEDEVRRDETIVERLLEFVRFEESELASMMNRLRQIDEDLVRNKDDRTLKSMGSESFKKLNSGECPTCHQAIQDSLLPLAEQQGVMTLDQNIAFLEQQRRTILGVVGEARASVDARNQQILAIRSEIAVKRSRVRALRQTLVSDGRLPSAAAIEERLRLEHEIERLEKAADSFNQSLVQFGEIAEELRRIRADLSSLPKQNTSQTDREKIRRWGELMQGQLGQFGFGSFSPDEIQISDDQYRPKHEGFDLPSSISASDLVRTIWAYLMGMMELAREFSVDHPGLLVFDEPRQQSAREVSFSELLRRAAKSREYSQQVVFFTSEEPSLLQAALDGFEYKLQDFGDDEKVIRLTTD